MNRRIKGMNKCADCNCTPQECLESSSASKCPNCTLDVCCCWQAIHYK
ncbi:hypothetical protein [Nitrososphaera sp.]